MTNHLSWGGISPISLVTIQSLDIGYQVDVSQADIALYDAWAVYGLASQRGQTVGGFTVPFAGVPRPDDVEAARRRAISYAAYRLIESSSRSCRQTINQTQAKQ